MDSRIAGHHVSRLEIVETGRRRRWSASEKLRIVEESYSAPRQGSATARRHGISNQLLNLWRKAAREGRLGIGPVNGFVPVQRDNEAASGASIKMRMPEAWNAGRA